MAASLVVQLAVTFTWLGMVLAISFLEAPLKFRAPGITIPLGVGIGRLVFRALNLTESALAIVIAIAMILAPRERAATVVVYVVLAAVLTVGAAAVRPLMDRTVVAGTVSSGEPRTVLHIAYVVLELAKVVLLIALGVLTATTA